MSSSLPMHAVRKESSTTTKTRVVFDASAKSASGVSLSDILMVGPNIHSPLIDVLLRFRLHRVGLIADVSKMYRGVALVNTSFYIDDCLTGADTVEGAVELQVQLQDLLGEAKFLLHKWNPSDPAALDHVSPELKESHFSLEISDAAGHTKTLGIEWDSRKDCFQLTITEPPEVNTLTKRQLTSDIAKIFDVLGWFSPSVIKAKILLQKLWETKVDWDQAVPQDLFGVWQRWRAELKILSNKQLPRCYFPSGADRRSTQLHGFCDASEDAFAAVVYVRVVDSDGIAHVSLVMLKTRVAPLKRLTIPRLEFCGAHLLAQILPHIQQVLNLSDCEVFVWTDSTIVLSWLAGDPRRFKPYVGNRVIHILENVATSKWRHVSGLNNPADCASRGLFLSELVKHDLWWNGPHWLLLDPANWPQGSSQHNPESIVPEEEKNVIFATVTTEVEDDLIDMHCFSSFTRLKHVMAWIYRLVNNCRSKSGRSTGFISTAELNKAQNYLIRKAQCHRFQTELDALQRRVPLPNASCFKALHPFIDSFGVLRVGGRVSNSDFVYSQRYPVILHGQHPLAKLLIRSEHVRLLHGGPTLVASSLSRNFHLIGQHKAVQSVTRACVVCRRTLCKPQPPLMGQLPIDRITPGVVFECVGIDYAGPVYLKLGRVRKPTVVKAYICIFVAFSVKAVHIELVSDLTSASFIACLRRFIACRDKPNRIWSDHKSNFVGASQELTELSAFFEQQKTTGDISNFCTSQNIEWSFIPEHTPHFGGLWESAVKSTKIHLRRILGDVRLTFEESSTVLSQVEACLNSRPLVPLPSDDDGIEALTPGHFLIGRPLEALPDSISSFQSLSSLRRWNLCQALARHFWKRWSSDYFASLRKFTKWHSSSRNVKAGDVVLLKDDGIVPTKWPLGRIVELYPGRDGIVRVVKVQTTSGTYKRPVTKVALLLATD